MARVNKKQDSKYTSKKSDKTLQKTGEIKLPKSLIKKLAVKKLEEEVLEIDVKDEKDEKSASRDMLSHVLFKIPTVVKPLMGTPQEVQKKLDSLAKKLQKEKDNDEIFDKIHLYMHGYLINVVLKKFPFIQGLQTVDVYQEALIALRFKAIPNFKRHKGMSFLNFAKMCIRRHLITLLHASKNRIKDQAINRAVSLDSSPFHGDEGDETTTFANIIPDLTPDAGTEMASTEAFNVTRKTLMDSLSDFERVVLQEYLSDKTYREIAVDVSKVLKEKFDTKSIDNALLRIRKKAISIKRVCKSDDIPIFNLPLEKKCTSKSVDNALQRIREKAKLLRNDSKMDEYLELLSTPKR